MISRHKHQAVFELWGQGGGREREEEGHTPPPLAIGVTETYREGASCVGREDTEKLVICVCIPQGHRSGVLNTPL